MTDFFRFAALPLFFLGISIPGNSLAQDRETGGTADPPKPATAPVQKTIDRQELKRLIAEKLAAKADPEVIKLLLDQARSGEKRSLDPLADQEAFEKLLLEMEELKKMTAEVRKETVGDLVDQSPTDPVEVIVNQTIKRLSARVGGDPRGESAGAEARFGQPIPEYVNTPLMLDKVNHLRKTQTALRKQLEGNSDEDSGPLLAAMILAQEELLWEAAWPFTEAEVAKIEEAEGKVSREIYLGRLKRGLATVNETLASERASVGRGAPSRKFVLYRPAEAEEAKAIDTRLLDHRGHADAWQELAVPFDEEAAKLLSVREGQSD